MNSQPTTSLFQRIAALTCTTLADQTAFSAAQSACRMLGLDTDRNPLAILTLADDLTSYGPSARFNVIRSCDGTTVRIEVADNNIRFVCAEAWVETQYNRHLGTADRYFYWES